MRGAGASVGGGGRGGGLLGAWLVAALLAPCPAAAADGAADASCREAAGAERLARELEANRARRARFLSGAGEAPRTGGAGAAATTRAAAGEAAGATRALVPQLRQAAAAARHDRGIVPGLGDWFERLAGDLERAVHALEGCAGAPGRCTLPALPCPAPPPPPAARGRDAFSRQVQQAYAGNAARMRQACLDLGGSLRRWREQAAGAERASIAGAPAFPAGAVDLYTPRIVALRRHASRHRQEADRLAGVVAYCALGERAGPAARAPRPAAPAGPEPAAPRVVDLSATWSVGWTSGRPLGAAVPPLPVVGAEGEDGAARRKALAADQDGADGPPWAREAREPRAEDGPGEERGRVAGWVSDRWQSVRDAYREADRRVELTEFLLERPKALVEEVVTGVVELLPYGKTVTVGYKLLGATRDTAEEVLQIVGEAPAVLAYGSAEAHRALGRRAAKVPVNYLNAVFDDVTGKLPRPRDPGEAGRE